MKSIQTKSKKKLHKNLLRKPNFIFFIFGFICVLIFFTTKQITHQSVLSAVTQQSINPKFYCLGNNSCGSTTITPISTSEPNILPKTLIKPSNQIQKPSNSFLSQHIATSSPTLNKCSRRAIKRSIRQKFIAFILNYVCQNFGIYCKLAASLPSVTTQTCQPPTNTPVVTSPTSPAITTTITPSVTSQPTGTPPPTPTSTVTSSPTTSQTVTLPAQSGGNWGGYVYSLAANTTNATIESSWIITSSTCTAKNVLSPWIGFGGYNASDPNIAQLGTDFDCSNGTPVYSVWTEAFPADSIYYRNDPVKSGDQITSSIVYQGNGAFATTIADVTQGWTITTPMSFTGNYIPQTGEYIVEKLNQGVNLQQFDPITFSNDFQSSNGQPKEPLSAASNLQNLYLFDKNVQETTNSAINGSSFMINFLHP